MDGLALSGRSILVMEPDLSVAQGQAIVQALVTMLGQDPRPAPTTHLGQPK
jgi:hypothetical protein